MDEITEQPGGKAALTACVRVPHEDKPGARRQEVRTYATVTPALLDLRDWLTCQGVTLVVMEATGMGPNMNELDIVQVVQSRTRL
jgi:hypothetical protein